MPTAHAAEVVSVTSAGLHRRRLRPHDQLTLAMWSPELRFNWKKNPRISGREQVKATCLGVSCTYVCRACRHPRVCNGVHLIDRSARSDFVGVSSSQVAPWLRGLFLFRFTRIVRHCHFRQTPRLRMKLFLVQGSRQEAESRRRSGGGRGDRAGQRSLGITVAGSRRPRHLG